MQIQDHKQYLRDVFLGAALRPEDMKRSCRAVLGSLPILANALMGDLGKAVRIQHGHQLGATDGSTIYLMDLPVPTDETDVDTFVLMLALAYGLLHHELGHVEDSDFEVVGRAQKGDPLTFRILGIIEDVREENEHIRKHGGARKYLDALNHAMFVTGHYADSTPTDAPITAFTSYLAHRAWCDHRGTHSLASSAMAAEEVVKGMFPATLLTRLDAILPRVGSLIDTEDAYALSGQIRDLLVEEIEQAKQQQSQQAGQSGQAGNAGDDQGQGDQQPSSDGDGGSSPEADQDDGDAQQQGGHDQEPTNGDDLADQIAAMEAVLQGQDIDQAYGDKGDLIRAALKQIIAEVKDDGDGDCDMLPMTGQALTVDVTSSTDGIELAAEPYDMGQALAVTGPLRMKLTAEMQANAHRNASIHSKGRKISNRHLARVGSGDGRIFKHLSEVIEVNTAVAFAEDISSSMRTQQRIVLSSQALYASCVALDGIDGVDCGAITFPGNQILKPFGKKARHCMDQFNLAAPGYSTPMHEGITLAHRMLLKTGRDRMVLIVNTDGEPDSRQLTQMAIETAENDGVEVYGLGIGTDAGKGLFNHWLSITDVSELPNTLMQLLRQRLLHAA
ncbi:MULTISPECIES: hypothetical protein [unclassified Dyella]|uniref:hypothetical protein n=1 Tax=Dyella sp. ASV21 TaxID=2795114 RepID=UPI0018EE423C|nr:MULTISPECIES: hypothetical protein [unclassified Dyella]